MDDHDHPEEVKKELYLAQFADLEATLNLSAGTSLTVALSGELLIEIIEGEDQPLVAGIRRIYLWIPEVDSLGGQTGFAAPLEALVFEPTANNLEKPFEPLDMNVFYPQLLELGVACRDSDATYVHLETLQGLLTWNIAGVGDNTLEISLAVELNSLVVSFPGAGAVSGLVFAPQNPLEFRRLQAEGAVGPPANSLGECTGNAPAGSGHDRRGLRLRFVTLSKIYTSGASIIDPASGQTLEDMVNWLLEGACEVWWKKGGVKMLPVPVNIVSHTPVGAQNFDQVGSENEELSLHSIENNPNAVEVYLVDELTLRPGGGVTHNCFSDQAFIILEIGKARYNKYLLAHEVGHVFGLNHPQGAAGSDCPGACNASYCSVMLPDDPNSSRNTEHNLWVLEPPQPPPTPVCHTSTASPIGDVLTSLGSECGWDPDVPQNYFHIVRDFPYDDGTQDSVPKPPAKYWWTHSDVWNSLSASSGFNPDHSPMHQEPRRAAKGLASITNHMFVRVHTCQDLVTGANTAANARVHLFLGRPGSASDPLERISPVLQSPADILSGGLVLSQGQGTFPNPSSPAIVMQNWIVPGTMPPHGCVFAVVVSNVDPPPADVAAAITNPAGSTFYTLFNRIKNDNDVAQRNLHVQDVSTATAPMRSVLNWILADNPFDAPAPAFLEIDTSLAAGLANLMLEVEGNSPVEVNIAPAQPVKRFEIAPALGPGERQIIRLRAEMPPNLPIGTAFPIDLSIFMGDVQVSGFRHVLRVAPLREVAIQVLDWLYAALEDVAQGCRLPEATGLARKVRLIWLREYRDIKPLRGCLFWPLRLLGFRTHTWEIELSKFADNLSEVASQLLSPGATPECREIGKRVAELAELVGAPKAMPVAVYLERLRELADQIQERASRLA